MPAAHPVELVCSACKRPATLTTPRTGAVPACATCGKALALVTPALFTCAPCGVRSKPTTADPNLPRPCPKCREPLTVEGTTAPKPALSQLATVLDSPRANDSSASSGASEFGSNAEPDMPGFAEWTPDGPKPVAAKAPAGSSTLAPGGTFGRYHIERELARGGMGIVYIATDPQLKRRVALKVLIAGEAASNEAVQRFVREARSAGQLRHPNIVGVHDAGEIDGRHFFTMDLIDGKELGDLVDAGKIPRATLLGWMRTVCLALHHAHEHGIIHRDLKPQNIMIEGDRPVVMDFGLAKEVDANSFRSLSGTVFGTPAYMSPEQAQGLTREIDRRTDVYSLGVILYELVCGQRPFGGNTLFDTIAAVVNDEPRPPLTLRRDVDADLNTIILRCMEKDAAARYPTAKELADDIGRHLEGSVINARPVAAPVRLWRKLRKRPALVTGIGGALVASVLAVVLFGGESLIGRLKREVASGDAERQRAAAVLLAGELHEGRLAGTQREQGLALLRQLAEGGGPAAEAAIPALVEAKDKQAVPVLRKRAIDDAVPVAERRAAAAALGTLAAKTDDAGAIAGELIAAAVASGQAMVAQALIPPAMALDPEGASQALAGPLTDGKRPSAWRVEATQALALSRPSLHGGSMRLLLRLSGDPDAAVGDAAARGLDLLRTRAEILPAYGLESGGAAVVAGMGQMAKAVADRDRAFTEELSEMEGGDNGRSPVTVIAAKLSASDAETRLAAASDLGRLGDAAALPHLYTALDDRDSGVRRAAGRSLAALAPSSPPDLVAVAKRLESVDSGTRADTAWTLGLLEAREAVPALSALLGGANERREQEAIIAALGHIGDAAALPALQAAWDKAGADEAMALAVTRALGGRKALGGAAIDALIAALDHRSRAVREVATTALVDATGEKLPMDPVRWKAWRQRAQ